MQKAVMEGWKTYVIGALMVIVSGLHAMGYISQEWFNSVMAFLTGGAAMALRHGQTTEAKKIKSEVKAEIREEAHKTREESRTSAMQEGTDPRSFRDLPKK